MTDLSDRRGEPPAAGLGTLLAGDPALRRYVAQRAAAGATADAAFRFAVEGVTRAGSQTRVTGRTVSGAGAAGDSVVVAPSGDATRLAAAAAAELILDGAPAVEPGDLIGPPEAPPQVGHVIQATIVWLGDEPLLRGRNYTVALGARSLTATVAPLRYKLTVDSLARVAATTLQRGELGVGDLELSMPAAFDPFAENPGTGSFALIDRISGATVGVGLIEFALRRSANVRWQELSVDHTARAASMGQTPCMLWFTGLSGAGKSTIANRVEAELHSRGRHTYLLDGDNVRHGLNRDLGFTDADRVENIRRVAEVGKLMVDAGLIVITSFISPFASERRMARSLFDPEQFIEVYVDTPLQVAEERDPKGLYAKARSGELLNFTGIDSPYEPPEHPELRVNTTLLSPAQAATRVVELLERSGLVPAA